RGVAETARRLASRVGHYTFISSISVYADPVPVGADESAPLATLADPAVETMSGETYGALKVLCEQEVESALPGRALHVRAGLLVGPWDYTDRFGYWVRRLAEGGDVLVPDVPDQPIQWIDARDAAAWIVLQAETGTAGVFNVTGPREPATLGDFVEQLRATVGATANLVPVSPGFLSGQGVEPWMEMPMWIPDVVGFLSLSISRALEHGLTLRPLSATCRDTHEWLRGEGRNVKPSTITALPPHASLTRGRERELLAAWAAR
ncbi:MAG: NAD-dependent epimerase/dehydratase family protein, partial [Candidatus Eisenbacteria bacterium]